jgi:NAD(P)-dependent dehydrogenase (short-subunit alcohol dehydrogenase family)
MAAVVALTDAARQHGSLAALVHTSDETLNESRLEHLFDAGVSMLQGLDAVVALVEASELPNVHEMSAGEWQVAVMQPLRSAFWLARRTAEVFLADATQGRLVLSIAPRAAGPNEVVVTGVRSLASCFAREYGRRGLACNVVIARASVHGRETTASFVELVLFLASPASSFVNGEALVIDA